MDTTKPKRAYRKHKPLSPEQELDLLEMYCTTDQPIDKLGQLFDVGPTYVYRVLERHGIDWRRDSTDTFDFAAWRGVQDVTPAPVPGYPERHAVAAPDLHERLERLNADTGFRTPTPTYDAPSIRIELEIPNTMWLVEITEAIEIEAQTIDLALAEGHRLRPGARITSVRSRL